MNKTCGIFRYASWNTWNRIGFCRSRKLTVYENTITQNLLFFLFYHPGVISGIELSEAENEATNGNDLLIEINTHDGYLKLPTQCKIIYKNGYYDKLRYGDQINDLIRYAESPAISGVPIYLFYNWYEPFEVNKELCGLPVSTEDYGCSFVDAYTLRNNFVRGTTSKGFPNWKIPSFTDLHPNLCDPLWKLVCCHDHNDSGENLLTQLNFDRKDGKILFHKDSEAANFGWRKISSQSKIIPEGEGSIQSTGFNPKFKIRINNID